MINGTSKLTVSVKDATELTGISKTVLYELLSAKKITSVHIGTKRLIHVESLRRLLLPSLAAESGDQNEQR
jgi:excisionase family DNA binding protein